MAEILTSSLQNKKNGTRSKKLSTRVDFTPMVDLGFLLITFFIFTSTLTRPRAMKLNMPAPGGDMKIAESKTLTLLLAKNNSVAYYSGKNLAQLQYTNFSSGGIRTIIQQHKQHVTQLFGKENKEFIIIKPTNEASYKNVVDVLDEMLINNIKGYVLTDADEQEKHYINK